MKRFIPAGVYHIFTGPDHVLFIVGLLLLGGSLLRLLSIVTSFTIGQACIVVVVASLLALLRNRNQQLSRQVLVGGSVCVMLAGSYWFIQRVFFR